MLSLTILKNQLAFSTINGWFSQVSCSGDKKTVLLSVMLHNSGVSPLFRTPGLVVSFRFISLAFF
jgi:hypothetical protein